MEQAGKNKKRKNHIAVNREPAGYTGFPEKRLCGWRDSNPHASQR